MNDAPPLITDDPALAAAAATSGHAKPMAAPMPFQDDADAIAASQRTQEVEAAYACQPFTWKDQQLAPFAISREGDWIQHRIALGCPPLDQLIGTPALMIADAYRVLWFCAHEPKEWLHQPTMKQDEAGQWHTVSLMDRAIALEERIRQWADEHILPVEQVLAVNLFYDIYNRAHTTRTAIKPHPHHDATKAGN